MSEPHRRPRPWTKFYELLRCTPHLSPRCETPLCRLQLGEPAAFLLHQVELHAANRLHRVEDLLPRSDALAEQDAKALLLGLRAGRPILQVNAPDASRMAFDPGDRVGAGFDAGADVELEHELRRRVRRQDVHDALAA